MIKTDEKSRPTKSRLSWSIGLTLLCGAILVALPWKTQSSRSGIALLAFNDDKIIYHAAELQQRASSNGKLRYSCSVTRFSAPETRMEI